MEFKSFMESKIDFLRNVEPIIFLKLAASIAYLTYIMRRLLSFLVDYEMYILLVVNLKIFEFQCSCLQEDSDVNDRHIKCLKFNGNLCAMIREHKSVRIEKISIRRRI